MTFKWKNQRISSQTSSHDVSAFDKVSYHSLTLRHFLHLSFKMLAWFPKASLLLVLWLVKLDHHL
jgi:hypothetical protein